MPAHPFEVELCSAIETKDLEMVRLGIQNILANPPASLEYRNEKNETFLHLALNSRSPELFLLLFDQLKRSRVTLQAKNKQGQNLFLLAMKTGYGDPGALFDAYKELTNEQEALDWMMQKDKSKQTALSLAAENVNLKLIRFILDKLKSYSELPEFSKKYKEYIDTPEVAGNTALHVTQMSKEPHKFKASILLIEAGADLVKPNFKKQTFFTMIPPEDCELLFKAFLNLSDRHKRRVLQCLRLGVHLELENKQLCDMYLMLLQPNSLRDWIYNTKKFRPEFFKKQLTIEELSFANVNAGLDAALENLNKCIQELDKELVRLKLLNDTKKYAVGIMIYIALFTLILSLFVGSYFLAAYFLGTYAMFPEFIGAWLGSTLPYYKTLIGGVEQMIEQAFKIFATDKALSTLYISKNSLSNLTTNAGWDIPHQIRDDLNSSMNKLEQLGTNIYVDLSPLTPRIDAIKLALDKLNDELMIQEPTDDLHTTLQTPTT